MKHSLPYRACVVTLLTAFLATSHCRLATAAAGPGKTTQPAAQPALPTKEGLATLPGSAPEIPDKVPQFVDYSLKMEDEKFYLYIPPNYRGAEPFGLLVFIHAGDDMDVPADWKPLLAKRKLLYIAPQKAGNSYSSNRRVGLAVMGLCKMMEMCKIDPRRVYVTGMSGGARVACLTAFAHPKLVSAVLPMCGAEFPAAVPKVLATRDDPYGAFQCDLKLVEMANENVGFALITGPNDFRHGNILDIYNGGYLANKYRAKVFDVPGMGHEIAPVRVIDLALDWLERGAGQAKLKKEADPGKPARKPGTGDQEAASQPQPARADEPTASAPGNPEAEARRQLNLAENYRRAGLASKALGILRSVIKDFPNTAAAKDAKELVKQLEDETRKADKGS